MNSWADLNNEERKKKWNIKDKQKVSITDKRAEVSSNGATDHEQQGAACRKLFASVITLAIRDSTLKPFESFGKLRMQNEASSAMSFLFGGRCDFYLEFLDIDPSHFRKSLIDSMSGVKNNSATSVFFKLVTPMQRRAFMFNHRHLENISIPKLNYVDTEYED
jgi:hypothetical protein